MSQPIALFQGTLDLLILRALVFGPAHGYAIARWIERATGDALSIEEGSLYPALHRLEERGHVSAEWGLSENNRRAKFYAMTPEGRRQLRTESATWHKFAKAVLAALEAPANPAGVTA